MNLIFKKVLKKSNFIKELLQDKPQILIHDGKIEFKDLMGSIINMGSEHFTEEDFNEEDFN